MLRRPISRFVDVHTQWPAIGDAKNAYSHTVHGFCGVAAGDGSIVKRVGLWHKLHYLDLLWICRIVLSTTNPQQIEALEFEAISHCLPDTFNG